MTRSLVLTVLLGFALGAGGRWLGRRGDDVKANPVAPPPAKSSAEETARKEIAAALAQPPPTLQDVLGTTDALDRAEKLALFLPHSTPADLKALLADFGTEQTFATRSMARSMILQRWVAIDLVGAMATTGNSLFREWAAVDPEAALAEARKRPKPKDASAIADVASVIALTQPDRALAMLEEDPRLRVDGGFMDGVLRGLCKAGRWREAAEFSDREGTSSLILSDWARKEPEAAFAWLVEANRAGRQKDYLGGTFSAILEAHPEKAEGLLATLPEGQSKTHLTNLLATSKAATDLETALRLVEQHTNDGARFQAKAGIASTLASTDSQKALEILRQLDWKNPPTAPGPLGPSYPGSSPGPQGDLDSAKWAVHSLARHDPAAATELLAQMPDNELARGACGQAVAGWAARDSMSASEWVSGLPKGGKKDSSVAALVEFLASNERDYDSAIRWGLSFSDPARARKEVTEIYDRWMRFDPQAARKGLATLGLPEPLRQELETRVPPEP